LAVPIILVIYAVSKMLQDANKAISATGNWILDSYVAKRRLLTNQHYFDREDVYLDYEHNQWFYKPGFPKTDINNLSQ
jgi:hypothetical protein